MTPTQVALTATAIAALLILSRRRRPKSAPAAIKATTDAHKATRPLGSRSGIKVTVLGQGGAPLGDLYKKLEDATALSTIAAAHAAGVAYFDTSPWYGVGLSEQRMGLALHRLPRRSFVFQTKVGRYLIPDTAAKNGTSVGWIGGLHMKIKFDYSGEASSAT